MYNLKSIGGFDRLLQLIREQNSSNVKDKEKSQEQQSQQIQNTTTNDEEKGKSIAAAVSASVALAGPGTEREAGVQQQEELGIEPISISRIRKSPTSLGAVSEAFEALISLIFSSLMYSIK